MLFDQVMRYVLAVRLMREREAATILEIGSGATGLGPYWPRPVVGCDLAFRGTLHPGLRALVASALALPFADCAFDGVCSLDTLEHIPPEQRARALTEMGRVASRWLLVGCPVGRAAQRCDQGLARLYRLRGTPLPEWLAEHGQGPFPRRREVRVAQIAGLKLVAEFGNENVLVHFLGILLETRAWFRRWGGEYLQRHPRLTSLLSLGPCYRRFFLWARLAEGE